MDTPIREAICGKWSSSDIINIVEENKNKEEIDQITFSDTYTFYPDGRAERIYDSSDGCFEHTFFHYYTKSDILYTIFDDSEEIEKYNIVLVDNTLDIMTSNRSWIRLKRINNQSAI